MIIGFDQPSFLIGGNGIDMWATTPLDLPQPVLIGDDGHDFWQNKQLIGGEDNYLEMKSNWMKDIEKKDNFNPL